MGLASQTPIQTGLHVRNLVRVLDSIETALLVINKDDTISFANPRAGEILGRSLDELADANIGAVIAPISMLTNGSNSATEHREELAIIRPDGIQATIEYKLSYVQRDKHHDDSPLYALVFEDITQWVQLRGERDRLLQLAAVGELMPTILHELKNPLASISTTVEVIVEDLGPGDLRDQLHAVLWEIRRMRLTFDGIGVVGRSLRNSRVAAVDHACREATLVLRARAQAANVALSSDVPDLPLLPFDPSVVRAIVYNLVVNAIQACDANDSISIVAHLQEGDGVFALVVSDTGRGMDPETLARCTQLFYTTKTRGSGIGLALCERATKQAGGELKIESKLGEGTVVWVRVPIRA